MEQPNLRKVIEEEYKRCATDPLYFINKYGVIQHATKGLVKFKLFDYQEDILTDFINHDYNIILKARQLGLSTLVAGYALWMMLFNNNRNILVVATKTDKAKDVVTKVRVMNDNLPVWLRGQYFENNKLSLKFKNGSFIKAVSSLASSLRGDALSLLIVDEAAFIPKAEEIWGAASSTLATGGKAVLISTPNGSSGFFYDKWKEAEAKKASNQPSQFNTIKIDWRVHPERDQAWRDKQDELAVSKELAIQENDAEFLTSGNTIIPGVVIDWYRKTHGKAPIAIHHLHDEIWIWKKPDFSKTYIVCADVSRGDADDFSTFHVIEAETCEQVAEFEGKVDTRQMGNLLVAISTEYNDALLVIENNTYGMSAIQQVMDRGYKNLFYTDKDMKYIDPDGKLKQVSEKRLPGFTTSPITRPLIINKWKEYMMDQSIIINSHRFINQMDSFVWGAGGKAVPSTKKYHDDLIFAYCIGLWVREFALRIRTQKNDSTRTNLQNFTRVYNSGDAPGFATSKHIQPLTMNIQGVEESLNWLYDPKQ